MTNDTMSQNATVSALPSVVQERVLAGLLGGATVTAAARAAKVDRATIHRWFAEDPVFIATYNSCRNEMADAVRQEIRFLAAEAIKTLRSVLTDEATPAAVRLKAAGEVLKLVMEENLTGPSNVEDAEAALEKSVMDRRLRRRPERLV